MPLYPKEENIQSYFFKGERSFIFAFFLRGAKRAYIDVEFSMLKCDSEKAINCRETFNLYYFESYADVASSTYPPWQERPYIKIDTIAAGKLFSNSEGENDKEINRKTWTLGPLTK